MRVLLVHNRYRSSSPGGEDRVVDQEAAALAAMGHAVERFERHSDDIAGSSWGRKALVPAQIVWSESSRDSVTRVLCNFQPDVVHVHNTFPLLSPSVLYACQAERTPVVATLHNYRLVCASGDLFRDGEACTDCVGRLPLPAVHHGCYRNSKLATLPLAAGLLLHARAWKTMVSAYVCLSRNQRDIFAAVGFPTDRLFVKPNFVPPAPIEVASPGDFVVYAGRMAATKGLNVLMAAWDRYLASSRREKRLRLVLAGAGPMEPEVSGWAASRASVDWLGMLSNSECASVLARARAVIVPSLWKETFGLVAVEAMAAGVPPVASAHGSFPEFIIDGGNGVLVEPGDASALTDVLLDIGSRPDRYIALGRAARRTYEEHFAVEPNIDRLLDIYDYATNHPAYDSPKTRGGNSAAPLTG